MPIVAVDGLEMYYERAGSGPRLLFFNGTGSTLEDMRGLLTVLARSFDLLAHDQRGLGRTSIPTGPYTMSEYASDAVALLDHVGWSSCRVIGISFGGMVAQEFAVTVPERVERLALLCTSPGGPGGSSYPLEQLTTLPEDEQAAMGAVLLDTRFTEPWLHEHPDDHGLASALIARRQRARTVDQRRGEREQVAARARHDVWDRLPRITCPTLVAAGRYDGIAPLANSEAIAGRIPDSELRVYDGGHAFIAQDPHALRDVVGFLLFP